MELKPHQVEAVQFLEDNKRAILGDLPGLGKTRVALLASVEPVLVVCPKSLFYVWKSEAEKVGLDSDKIDVYSYGMLSRGNLPEDYIKYKTVIFDEAHRLTNHKSKTFIGALQLSRVAVNVFLVTGSTYNNYSHEVYGLLRLLDPVDSHLRSYWRWVNTYFTVTNSYHHRGKDIGKLRVPTEAFWKGNRLSSRYLTRDFDDVGIELPELTTASKTVHMGPNQRKLYRELEGDWRVDVGPGDALDLWSQGALFSSLLMMSTGVGVFLDPPTSVSSAKLDYLRSLDTGSRRLLVFARYRSTAKAAQSVLQGSSALLTGEYSPAARGTAVERFQRGDVDHIVATLASAGEGHTMTQADEVVLIESPWTVTARDQAIRRAWRIGRDKTLRATSLFTHDTVDERVRALLKIKGEDRKKFGNVKET